jgi:hypothetical protein
MEGFEHDDEAVRQALAELGATPLPPAVAARLDTRLAAELSASPFAARRQRRRRLQLGASLSTAAAVAAAIVFALSTGGGGRPAGGDSATAVRDAATSVMADAAAAKTTASTTERFSVQAPAKKQCPPATPKDGPRPAACPGARGGHARAV